MGISYGQYKHMNEQTNERTIAGTERIKSSCELTREYEMLTVTQYGKKEKKKTEKKTQ